MGPKINQKSASAPKGSPDAPRTPPGVPPEASKEPFWQLVKPFWINFGGFLSPFSELKRSQSKRLEETREDTFPRSQDASKPPRFETIRGRRHGGGALKIYDFMMILELKKYALRVFPAETRLTVYCRRPVFQ